MTYICTHVCMSTLCWQYIGVYISPSYIRCVVFGLSGVGCTNGVVCVLDAISLQDVCEPFEFAKDCITHIVFSHDSRYLATAVSG